MDSKRKARAPSTRAHQLTAHLDWQGRYLKLTSCTPISGVGRLRAPLVCAATLSIASLARQPLLHMPRADHQTWDKERGRLSAAVAALPSPGWTVIEFARQGKMVWEKGTGFQMFWAGKTGCVSPASAPAPELLTPHA